MIYSGNRIESDIQKKYAEQCLNQIRSPLRVAGMGFCEEKGNK